VHAEPVALDHLSEQHRRALEQAVAFVRGRYEPWGILVTGTIVRGAPDPNSDLDLYVLHDAPFRQRVQRWFNGVAVEIFVNSESAVSGYLESESRDGELITAHMLATGVVLLATDPHRMEELRLRARASLDQPPRWTEAQLVRGRYAAASFVEDAIDKREADPEVSMRLLSRALEALVSYWFKKHGLNQPRQKEIVGKIESVDAELGALLRRFWGDSSWESRFEAGMTAVDRVLETRGFFEWESEKEPIS
jgi:hypothetical protein